MGTTILIADDEKEIRDLLCLYLENENYTVVEASDGIEALEKLSGTDFDLAIIDIMMPGMNGHTLVKRIRETNNLPVLFLSAKSDPHDRVLGLKLGADDYVTKPFNPLELCARVEAHLRRSQRFDTRLSERDRRIAIRDLVLDTEQCLLFRHGTPIDLTSTEYRILKQFMENPGRVFTKQQIYEAGWNESSFVDDNSIMVSISKLRAKLGDTESESIKTIRGLGYRFEK